MLLRLVLSIYKNTCAYHIQVLVGKKGMLHTF